MIARVSLAFALALLVACGQEPNSLSGSIEQNFDLTFDDVRFVRINGDAYQLEYLETLESGDQNVVTKVVFDAPDAITLEEDIDLLPLDARVTRVAGDGDFPAELDSAVLRFDEGGSDEGPASGEFAVTFSDGKTLNGTFDTQLEDLSL